MNFFYVEWIKELFDLLLLRIKVMDWGVGEVSHFMANKVMKCPSDVKQNKQKGENEYQKKNSFHFINKIISRPRPIYKVNLLSFFATKQRIFSDQIPSVWILTRQAIYRWYPSFTKLFKKFHNSLDFHISIQNMILIDWFYV